MYDDLVILRPAPPNRVAYCAGGIEQPLSEGAVMLAFAQYLLRTVYGLTVVTICPDGEYGKQFDIRRWLESKGFSMVRARGSTKYGGTYLSTDLKTIVVDPSSGRGDVLATAGKNSFVAECKGGVINTTHPGQASRLRKALCEAVGLLLASPRDENKTQFAVVPRTQVTEGLAKRLLPRANLAGVEIALVDDDGSVQVL